MDKIKFLFIAYLTVLMALFVIGFYRMVDLVKVEQEVKWEYQRILQNLSCRPKVIDDIFTQDRGCLRHGYYYPECINDSDVLNLYGVGKNGN